MKRILFQAGLAVSGASPVHRFCYAHMDALAACGVSIPWNQAADDDVWEVIGRGTLKHMDLPRFLQGNPELPDSKWLLRKPGTQFDWPAEFERFRTREAANTLLLSHESIPMIAPRIDWEMLDEATEGFTRTFLIYLREPVAWLNANIRQAIFSEGPFSLRPEGFPATRRYLARGYAAFLAPLAARGEVIVRFVDPQEGERERLVDFLHIVGAESLADEAAKAPAHPELDVGYDAIVFLRALKEVTGSPNTYRPLRDAMLEAYRASVAATGATVSEMILTEELTEQIAGQWQQDQAWLADEFGLETTNAEPARSTRATFELGADEADRLRERIRAAYAPGTEPIYEMALAAACGKAPPA